MQGGAILDKSKLSVIGLFLLAILFLAVTVFANATFRSERLDLTERKLFTLSDATREVLKAIDEPIKVRLYFSKILGDRSPQHAAYYARVRGLLEQYADLSKGMLQLELYNPEPFSDTEDRAVAFGLRGVPVTAAGELGYFGIAATNSTDDKSVIPFLNPEREGFIEYDLTKLVYTLTNPEKKVVGLISSLPLSGRFGPRAAAPWEIVNQIREFFDIRRLSADADSIPKDIDVLMIVHPKSLSDSMLYAIDQFVLRGGRALVFVDPAAETEALTSPGLMAVGPSKFNRTLKAWGLKLLDNKVAANLDAARRVNAGRGGRPEIADYVAWLSLGRENFDTGDVVTAGIDTLNLATPGILEKVKGAGTKVEPLITTTKRSMAVDADLVRFTPDVLSLLRSFKSENKSFMLAARVTGTAKTAFPDGPPAKKPSAKSGAKTGDKPAEKAKHLTRSIRPLNLIVVADADMLHDRFWLQRGNFLGQEVLLPTANNANFVINALDNLTGSDALITLRGRSGAARPFRLVERIRHDAELRYRAKEQQLLAKLKGLESKVTALTKRQGPAGDVILTADEKETIENFRTEMIAVRKQLRDVQHALRQNIDRLDSWLKFLNIAAIPLLLTLGTLAFAAIRRWRRSAYRHAT